MSSFTKRALLTLALALGIPAVAVAQSPAQAASPTEQEVSGWMAEIQQLHLQLESIQLRALEDSGLSAAQQELGEEIRDAMTKLDPQLAQRMGRIEVLEGEAEQAAAAGNVERFRELEMEAYQIQQHFFTVQGQVLQSSAIDAKVRAFQTRLESRMVEVDPTAKGLIERFRELELKLAAAMQSAGA
jgi:hypothetical protein